MMVLTMKNFNYKNIKSVEKIHLLLLLFIVMSTIINFIVNLMSCTENIFLTSLCLPIQFVSRFVVSHNPFEISVSIVLIAVTLIMLFWLFKMYSSDNMKKWLASGITAIWCLLIGSIIPILLDSDLIGQSGNNLTYEEKANELLLCVWFGIACSIFCGILFFIQISKYAKFMDRKYDNPMKAVAYEEKKNKKEYYHTLKKPLILPTVYAIIPPITCSFLIYLGVKSAFLICFIYVCLGIGIVYHTAYNISDFIKSENQNIKVTSIQNYKCKLIVMHILLMLLYCISLVIILLCI